MRRLILLAAILTGVSAPTADGSQLVDRNASAVTLAVNDQGEALLTYRAAGQLKHVLAWGAVNAIAPTQGATAGCAQARLLRRLRQVPA